MKWYSRLILGAVIAALGGGCAARAKPKVEEEISFDAIRAMPEFKALKTEEERTVFMAELYDVPVDQRIDHPYYRAEAWASMVMETPDVLQNNAGITDFQKFQISRSYFERGIAPLGPDSRPFMDSSLDESLKDYFICTGIGDNKEDAIDGVYWILGAMKFGREITEIYRWSDDSNFSIRVVADRYTSKTIRDHFEQYSTVFSNLRKAGIVFEKKHADEFKRKNLPVDQDAIVAYDINCNGQEIFGATTRAKAGIVISGEVKRCAAMIDRIAAQFLAAVHNYLRK